MTLLHGNNLDLLRAMPDNSVHAIVCDPPYGLGKEPDALAMLRDWIETGHHDVKSKSGFMGKTWDAFVPQPVQWRECLRVLKPGGHVLSFAGTRTHDLITMGLRIAGFEIRDQIDWIYGQGFPKSANVGCKCGGGAGGRRTCPTCKGIIGAEGFGTALKPALEPITLARKPLEGTVAANVLKWHTGALNVDGCRVAFASQADEHESKAKNQHGDFGSGPMTNEIYGAFSKDRANHNPPGRWPANVIHDGSDEVIALFPDTTERFFYSAKVSAKERNEGLEHLPDHDWQGDGAAVPERENRPFNPSKNHHPTVKPIALMRYLCRLITPPGGTVLDPWMGSGSTGKAATLEGFDFIGMEQDAGYFAIAQARCGVTTAQKHAELMLF